MYFGLTPVTNNIWLNLNPVGDGLASLYDRNNYYLFNTQPQAQIPVEGSYSFGMYPLLVTEPPVLFSLFQTGDVPSDAQTLRFTSFGRKVDVLINGTAVSVEYTLGPPTSNPNTRLASAVADISPYTGQTVELQFRSRPGFFDSQAGVNGLDSIYFSSVPIPESTTAAIGLLGLTVIMARFGCMRWRAKRQERKQSR